MMDSFLLAAQFLTILPLKIKGVTEEKIASAMVYFPVVGLLFGLMLWGINALLYILNFPALAINIILTIALIIITGGIHLDGVSDTVDALASGKAKERMLEIMRDPHIGVMGVLSLISIILLKISLLSSVSVSSKPIALLLMCALSRWSAAWVIFLFPYARQEGKARVFIQGMNLKIFILSLIVTFIFAFAIWRVKGLLVLLIIAGCSYLNGKIIARKIGGITGDTLGANIEFTEIIALFIVCIG